MRRGLWAGGLAFLAPAVAAACPVCGTPQNNATRDAYVGSTIFLSLFPLMLIGTLIGLGIWHVRRRERERERERGQDATSAAATSTSSA